MQAYDILMVIVLVVATVWGLWKGLAWQLASLSSIVLSCFVAFQFRQPVAQFLTQQLDVSQPWNVFLAMLILYLGTSMLVWVVFRYVRAFVDRVKLKEFDHQIGAIFGAAKGVVLCVIITYFAVTLVGEPQKKMIIDSRSGYYIAKLLDKSHGIMPQELHDVLHPHLHQLLEESHADSHIAGKRDGSPR